MSNNDNREEMIGLIQDAVGGCARHWAEVIADALIKQGFMKPPCKIGDKAWAVRNFGTIELPREGTVSEMHFTDDMRVLVIVKGICRGFWGEKIFPTKEAATEAYSLKNGGVDSDQENN